MTYIYILKVRKFHQSTRNRFRTAGKKPVGRAPSLNRVNPIQAGGGGGIRPPKVFLHNSKAPRDNEKKLSDFDFTPLTVILHILFTVCDVTFATKKQKHLNYFEDNYLIKLKFGREDYFYALNSNS